MRVPRSLGHSLSYKLWENFLEVFSIITLYRAILTFKLVFGRNPSVQLVIQRLQLSI